MGNPKAQLKDRQLDKALEAVRAKLASTQSPKKAEARGKSKIRRRRRQEAAERAPVVPRRATELGVG